MADHANALGTPGQAGATGAGLRPWLVVLGCALALATSSGAVVNLTLSLVLGPLGSEFQWNRTTISLGLSMMTLCLAITAPLAGRVFDRLGVVRTLVVAIPLFAASIAGFAFIPASVPAYLALFGIAGVLGAFHGSIPYVKVVSEWFDRGRGLALGVTMSGVALGGIVLTQSARIALERSGWRAGFLALAAVILVWGLGSVLLLVRERGVEARGGDRAQPAEGFPGATVAEALRDGHFWIILFFVFSLNMAASGIAASGAGVLGWKGATPAQAATMLGALAVASMVGRLATGFLLDRVFAPFVAVFIGVLSLAGMALLVFGQGNALVVIALVAIGFSLGAETDVIGYMLGRYFGLRSFGALFGMLVGAFALAPAVGIPLLGLSFDRNQSYAPTMTGFALAIVLSVVLILRLGPYKYRPPEH